MTERRVRKSVRRVKERDKEEKIDIKSQESMSGDPGSNLGEVSNLSALSFEYPR